MTPPAGLTQAATLLGFLASAQSASPNASSLTCCSMVRTGPRCPDACPPGNTPPTSDGPPTRYVMDTWYGQRSDQCLASSPACIRWIVDLTRWGGNTPGYPEYYTGTFRLSQGCVASLDTATYLSNGHAPSLDAAPPATPSPTSNNMEPATIALITIGALLRLVLIAAICFSWRKGTTLAAPQDATMCTSA